MSTELAHIRHPVGLADGETDRVVHSTPVALDSDEPVAMLIHEIAVSYDDLAATAGSANANGGLEIGLSTEEDGNPMAVFAPVNRRILWDAGQANDGGHSEIVEEDSLNMIEGTIWAAPYWVVFAFNEGLSGLFNFRVQIKYDLIELDDFRTQLALWNRVDEVQDRERATTVFP